MKILFCLNKDVYSAYVLNLILEKINLSEVKIYFSNRVGAEPISNPSLTELQEIEKDIQKYQSDKKAYKKYFLTFEEIISLNQIPVLDFKNINHDGLEYLKDQWTPDLIVSIRFGQIFKEPIINLPKFGIINLHSGILPDYRGIMATFWAMKDRQKEIGCTLHFINDNSIDTGDIIEIHKFSAHYDQSLMVNLMILYEGAAQILIKNINLITKETTIKAVKQDRNLGRYFSYPNADELRESKIKLF